MCTHTHTHIHKHSDTRFVNMSSPWAESGGTNTCASTGETLNCATFTGCTYNINQPNGNFSCPCALTGTVELIPTFAHQGISTKNYVYPGRKIRLEVAVTSTAASLPQGTPSLVVTLPVGDIVTYKTAIASPPLKPKTKPTQAGHALTWTPVSVPVGQKTAKRNTRTFRYILRVSKTAAAGAYVFPVAFRLLDTNGLIVEQVFGEATVRVGDGSHKLGGEASIELTVLTYSFFTHVIHSSTSDARREGGRSIF